MSIRTLAQNSWQRPGAWRRAAAVAALAAIVMGVCIAPAAHSWTDAQASTAIAGFRGAVSAGSEPLSLLPGPWTQIGATGGVAVHALALDPSNPSRIYAGTYFKGLYLTHNGGSNWSNPLPNSVAALAVSAQSPSTVYAGTWYSGMLRSINNGANWTPVNTGLAANDVYALAIDPVMSTTLYAGTEVGIFKSSNGGTNWQAASRGFSGRNVYALASCGGALLAGSDAGLFRSANGTADWAASNAGLAANEVYALAVAGDTVYSGTDQGAFRSNDCGASWRPAGELPPGAVNALAVAPNAWTVFAGTAEGAFVSYSRGATWTAMSDGLTGWAVQIHALALDSNAAPATLFAGTGSGVWKLNVEIPPIYQSYLPAVSRQ